jgi:hypothetical protein
MKPAGGKITESMQCSHMEKYTFYDAGRKRGDKRYQWRVHEWEMQKEQ